MVTKKKTKRGVQRRVTLTKGDWLDVLDHDGVWNVARVLSVPSPDEVEVMYDGWPDEYDEIVRIDSDRVAPYHTYTWAVKCWVKYLNWPMWPSIVTIRTPGNVEGIDSLRLEERLFVDFMEHPEFVKRDRCWNQKRKVKPFNLNFDKYRADSNGEMFEAALAAVLQSDATDKMLTFVKGTLPTQYKDMATVPVRQMRKEIGEELWYKNFLSNRQHHWRAHVYESVGKDPDEDEEEEEEDDELVSEDDSSSEKLEPKTKMKLKRMPKVKSKQAARRSQPPLTNSKRQKASRVKHEQQEEQEEVEDPYELKPMDSSGGESEDERAAAAVKRRRLRLDTRGKGSTAKAAVKAETKESHSTKMPKTLDNVQHNVLVLNDEIVMEEHKERRAHEKRVIRPKLSSAKSVPSMRTSPSTIVRGSARSQPSGRKLNPKSEPKPGYREGAALHRRKAPAKETDGVVGQKRSRRLSAKRAGELHNEAWTNLFSDTTGRAPGKVKKSDSIIELSGDESDDSIASTNFSLGVMTPEEKHSSPSDAQSSIGRASAAPMAATTVGGGGKKAPTDAANGFRQTGEGDRGRGHSKFVKKRVGVPHEDRELMASAKSAPKERLRHKRGEESGEGEEKEVPVPAKKPVVVNPVSTGVTAGSHATAAKKKTSSAGTASTSVKVVPKSAKSPKKANGPKESGSFVEQRIAFAQAILETEEEKRAIETEWAKDSLRVKSGGLQGSSRGRAEGSTLGRLTRVADQAEESPTQSRLGIRRARVIQTPVNQPVGPRHPDHSFLMLDKGGSSDSQEESKINGASFDKGAGSTSSLDNDGDERKAAAKIVSMVSGMVSSDEPVTPEAKSGSEEASTDEEGEGVARAVAQRLHWLRMGAAVTPTLDANHKMRSPDKRARPTTLVSMPRKFAGPTDGAPCVPTNATNSMLRVGPTLNLPGSKPMPSSSVALSTPSTAAFSSSEGFTLDSWFKRSLYAKFLNKDV